MLDRKSCKKLSKMLNRILNRKLYKIFERKSYIIFDRKLYKVLDRVFNRKSYECLIKSYVKCK